jgi:phosphatidylinositol glycan class B
MYGSPMCVPWNFFRVNVLSGVSAHYGVHPPHWYVTQGIPVIFGFVAAVPFANACIER